jgi:hypothetical protein
MKTIHNSDWQRFAVTLVWKQPFSPGQISSPQLPLCVSAHETPDMQMSRAMPQESVQVSTLQRIVKGLIPGVEPDLTGGRPRR